MENKDERIQCHSENAEEIVQRVFQHSFQTFVPTDTSTSPFPSAIDTMQRYNRAYSEVSESLLQKGL